MWVGGAYRAITARLGNCCQVRNVSQWCFKSTRFRLKDRCNVCQKSLVSSSMFCTFSCPSNSVVLFEVPGLVLYVVHRSFARMVNIV